MLTIDNLSFSYSRKSQPVIRDFSFKLESGNICGLLGKNGAGKSTLLYLICGLLRPTSGRIDCMGFTPYDRETAFLRDVFIVPEEFELPNMSLKEYVTINSGFYPHFDHSQYKKYLSMFEVDPGVHISQISMGQKKKAFLSFALACNTSLLILDEPTNGLDISSKRSFRSVLSMAMSDDKNIIISTHQIFDVEKILDHVIIMDSSEVLLNESLYEISRKLSFSFTNDRAKAQEALLSLEAPGGSNIVELSNGEETEVNLETLFELTQSNPQLIKNLFPNN